MKPSEAISHCVKLFRCWLCEILITLALDYVLPKGCVSSVDLAMDMIADDVAKEERAKHE
jgi:hypothetical protein